MQTNPEQWAVELVFDVYAKYCAGQRKDAIDAIQAAFAEQNALLVGALEQIATVDMGGGFLGAQACRKVALAALKDRPHG